METETEFFFVVMIIDRYEKWNEINEWMVYWTYLWVFVNIGRYYFLINEENRFDSITVIINFKTASTPFDPKFWIEYEEFQHFRARFTFRMQYLCLLSCSNLNVDGMRSIGFNPFDSNHSVWLRFVIISNINQL